MEILRGNTNFNIVINPKTTNSIDLGWDDSFKEYENEALLKVINPIENYETVRFIHKPYDLQLFPNEKQYGIWYYFNFLTGSTYSQEYEVVGISPKENAKMLKQSTESFFRLEFYKTPTHVYSHSVVAEPPNRKNRRLVMTRNLSLPSGEKRFDKTLNDNIHLPIFSGSNYRNKDVMYLFWFADDSVFDETNLKGDVFWMTAKFFNATDGSVLDFTNKDTINPIPGLDGRVGYTGAPITFYEKGNVEIDEGNDLYYKVIIDRTDNTYQIYRP